MPKLIKNLGVYRCIDVRTNTAASTSARKPLQPMVANQIGAHGI